MHDAQRSARPSVYRSALFLLATTLCLGSAGSVLMSAQAPAAGRTVWDGVYTDAQATRGTQTFGQSCTNCHTLAAQGNRPLTGDKFWEGWTQKSVADLLKFVSTNMPNGNGGSLSTATYNDVVALILKSNGFPAGMTELEPTTVADVQIIPKDGPGELPAGTLVRVVGCLARNGRDWVLTSATQPQRIEKAGPAPEDATRPLGERTTPLKFVLTRLDAFVGHRMVASGLLIGAGGAEGLNVTTVNRVAETCP
jgi:mono/diheme cytochrome c family protein